MGYGSYNAMDWAELRSSKKFSQSGSAESVFTGSSVSQKYNVFKLGDREARDSESSPQSVPVIIGFDVTSSMGYLAKELALNAVNKTVLSLYENTYIRYPHIMCAAVGDCKSDKTPLQVTQFEADIRIIKQLTELYLEGGGGGNDGESYNLLWYYAARHILADNYEKRRKKGFLFTIGDDKCHRNIRKNEIQRVFGDIEEYDISNEELLRETEEKFHVFHINIEKGESHDYEVLDMWQKLMSGRVTVIQKHDIAYLSELITAIISMTSGKTQNETMRSMDQYTAKTLSRSLSMIHTEQKGAAKKTIIL